MQMIELSQAEIQEVAGATLFPSTIGVFQNGIGLTAGITTLLQGTAYVGSEALFNVAYALTEALGGAWGPFVPA